MLVEFTDSNDDIVIINLSTITAITPWYADKPNKTVFLFDGSSDSNFHIVSIPYKRVMEELFSYGFIKGIIKNANPD